MSALNRNASSSTSAAFARKKACRFSPNLPLLVEPCSICPRDIVAKLTNTTSTAASADRSNGPRAYSANARQLPFSASPTSAESKLNPASEARHSAGVPLSARLQLSVRSQNASHNSPIDRSAVIPEFSFRRTR